tara:strand:+ start:972 stop:1430 length:459 start_codon:yes stop_codon:yes gene_type:complete
MKPKKIQTLIVLFALLVIGFLYQLPTSVIKTKKNQDEIQSAVSVEKALALLEGANPMEGVFMFREILENDPKNTEALYYLGVLSNQTGQYKNAIERFNQLITIDSSDKRAYLQLGISNHQLGYTKKADSLFRIVKETEDELLIKELNIFLTK